MGKDRMAASRNSSRIEPEYLRCAGILKAESFYFFLAERINLTSSSVTCGSSPSVWPLSARTTS